MRKIKLLFRGIIDKIFFLVRSNRLALVFYLGKILYGKKTSGVRGGVLANAVVFLNDPDNKAGVNDLPKEYFSAVKDVSEQMKQKVEKTVNCIYRSADGEINKKMFYAKKLPENTEDLDEIKQGKIGTIKLKNPSSINGVNRICDYLLPAIEKNIYGAPVTVDIVSIYRNIPSVLPEFASKLWHSDNHFEGVLKIMIYLSDVGIEQAPFTYLRHKLTGETVHISPSMPQKYPSGRIPKEVMDQYFDKGYESFFVLGTRGTTLLFDDKIIHKGNYAQTGYRDVLVLQLEPTWKKQTSYITPQTKWF